MDEFEELENVEKALDEWLELTPAKIVQKNSSGQVVAVEAKTEKDDEEVEITEERLKKLVENYLSKQGLIKRTVVVFELPSEYKGSRSEYVQEGGTVKEIRILKHDPAKFRTLRKKFYNALHKYAWNSPVGWILLSTTNLDEFNKIIDELNKLAGTQRVIQLVDVYLPAKQTEEWLNSWIQKIKLDSKYFLEKLREVEEGTREAKRLQKRYDELIEELEKLEKELEALQSL